MIARLLGVDNFGIAAVLGMIVSALEAAGNLSIDKFLIQSSEGDEEEFQAAAHTIQVLRGVVVGAVLFLIADPLGRFFNLPEVSWAFRVLALLPAIRGFAHLDVARSQRLLNFRSVVLLEVAQQAASLAAAWPIASTLRDYSAVLWLLIIQHGVWTVGSWLLATRPYRLGWNTTHAKRLWQFGWPIAVNTLLLLILYSGDRFLLAASSRLFGAHAYSIESLGLYAAATMLVYAPIAAMAAICSSLLLPVLSGLRDRPADFLHHYSLACQIANLVGGAYAMSFVLIGDAVAEGVFGPSYVQSALLIGWLSIGQFLRLARFVPITAALTRADSSISFPSNIVRACALAPMCIVIVTNSDLVWLAIAACAGELAATAVCLWRVQRAHALTHAIATRAFIPASLLVAVAAASAPMLGGASATPRTILLGALLIVLAAVTYARSPELRALVLGRNMPVV